MPTFDSRSGDSSHLERDGSTMMLLGGFLSLLATLVLVGLWFTSQTIDRWINLVAGLVLLAVGIAFVTNGRRRVQQARDGDTRTRAR